MTERNFYVVVKTYGIVNMHPSLADEKTLGPYTERGALIAAKRELGKEYLDHENRNVEEWHFDEKDDNRSLPVHKFKVAGWTRTREKREITDTGICRTSQIFRKVFK